MKTTLLSILCCIGFVANAQTTHMINWSMGTPVSDMSLTIANGDTVMWMWTDPMPHSVTSNSGGVESFDSGILSGVGQSFSYTFTNDGVTTYKCSRHAFMQGQITVNALSVGDNTTSIFVTYPNPVTDILTVSSQQNIERIIVFDATGKEVLNTAMQTPDAKIYMQHYPSGTYYVNAISGNEIKKIAVLKK